MEHTAGSPLSTLETGSISPPNSLQPYHHSLSRIPSLPSSVALLGLYPAQTSCPHCPHPLLSPVGTAHFSASETNGVHSPPWKSGAGADTQAGGTPPQRGPQTPRVHRAKELRCRC